eukprot:GHVL01042497.1.p1 GENE.GHVL01042497.1~~GHVL01042497.1.p1  ORF type:complete len:419 (+),score=65.87 GHVL01042497.1:2128-3384(+)
MNSLSMQHSIHSLSFSRNVMKSIYRSKSSARVLTQSVLVVKRSSHILHLAASLTSYSKMENSEEALESTLESLIAQKSLKWIFVGGKGGVGKTTTACSIAIQLAKQRESVLILSTDPAHNLSDALSQKLQSTPTKVEGFNNFYAMELDSKFQERVEFELKSNDGWQKVLADHLSSIPGVDEAMGFAELMQSVQSMEYETIVFDTAPTGHTLRLLGFPDLLDKALQKLLQLKVQMGGALNMLQTVAGMNVSEEDIMSKLDGFKAVTQSVRNHFKDPTKTTFVAVCIPEFLSVYETERLVQELAKYSIDCSNLVVNQVVFPVDMPTVIPPPIESQILDDLPENVKINIEYYSKKANVLESLYIARRRMQSKYLTQVDELYSFDFHIVCMPLQNEEVRGLEKLSKFGKLLLTKKDMPILIE